MRFSRSGAASYWMLARSAALRRTSEPAGLWAAGSPMQLQTIGSATRALKVASECTQRIATPPEEAQPAREADGDAGTWARDLDGERQGDGAEGREKTSRRRRWNRTVLNAVVNVLASTYWPPKRKKRVRACHSQMRATRAQMRARQVACRGAFVAALAARKCGRPRSNLSAGGEAA